MHTNFVSIFWLIFLTGRKMRPVTRRPGQWSIGTERSGTRNSVSADWEPAFIFSPDAGGRLQAYRNDGIVFGYAYTRPTQREQPNIGLNGDSRVLIGYLINREGDYFEKHASAF